MRITTGHVPNPDAETLVPCPGCGTGMVSSVRAAKLKEVLSGEPDAIASETPTLFPPEKKP